MRSFQIAHTLCVIISALRHIPSSLQNQARKEGRKGRKLREFWAFPTQAASRLSGKTSARGFSTAVLELTSQNIPSMQTFILTCARFKVQEPRPPDLYILSSALTVSRRSVSVARRLFRPRSIQPPVSFAPINLCLPSNSGARTKAQTIWRCG